MPAAPVRRSRRAGRAGIALLWLATLHPIAGRGDKVNGDGKRYYVYARAFVVHGDFRLHPGDAVPTEPRSSYLQEGYLLDAKANGGRIYTLYSAGCSLLWLPGVAAVHTGLRLGHRLGIPGLPPADGFSKPYRLSTAVTTALLGLAGLLMAFDLACAVAPPAVALLAVAAGLFATPLFNYLSYETSMSEGPSFFAVTLVFWIWWRIRNGAGWWGAWGLAIGLAGIIRSTQAPLALLPVVETLWPARKRPALRPLAALPGFALPWAIQAVVWKMSYGFWAPPPYDAGIASWRTFDPVMLLWSARHGLFATHPLWLGGVAGAAWLAWRRGALERAALAAFCFLVWVSQLAAMFWAGHSFGARWFVPATLTCILGLAWGFARAARRWRHGFAACAAVVLVFSALSFEALADYRALGERRDQPSPQGARVLPGAVYRAVGWPGSWPVNWIWAWGRHATPDRFDYLLVW